MVAGTGLEGYFVPSSASHVNAIAATTLSATSTTLAKAGRDGGVRYTFYLLAQLALASREPNWKSSLARHGINLADESTVFDLTAEMQGAIDRYVSHSGTGASDLSEMAQQAAGEALTSLLGTASLNLFQSAEA